MQRNKLEDEIISACGSYKEFCLQSGFDLPRICQIVSGEVKPTTVEQQAIDQAVSIVRKYSIGLGVGIMIKRTPEQIKATYG